MAGLLSRQQRTKSWTTGSASLAGGQATPAWWADTRTGDDLLGGLVAALLACEVWPERTTASSPAAGGRYHAALKDEPGGEIMAHGGAAFVQALSRLGLIDEYRLVILPVALGAGLPLFKDLARPLRVDLAEAATFPDGTAIHVYRPVALPAG